MPAPQGYTPAQKREWERARKAKYRADFGSEYDKRSFIGIDGEGFNILTPEGGKHHVYAVLTAGKRVLVRQDRQPLTTLDCLEFVSRLPAEYIYVGFFFDYDVTMILRDMPKEKVHRLLHPELRTVKLKKGGEHTYPVDFEGYQIDYRPKKEFRVRRVVGLNDKGKQTYSPFIVVNDIGSFFQCSFIKALERWNIGTDEERRIIGTGKALRGSHISLDADTLKYNALEVDLYVKLMDEFRGVCHAIGLHPNKWQGPGELATALLKKHGVKKSKQLDLPAEVLQAANVSFYGGRFETTAVGSIPAPIYNYDINSAYPDALTKLPCLEHGVWSEVTHDGPIEGLYLAHGEYRPNSKRVPNLYGFPHRDRHGTIRYAARGSGWYWGCEIEAAPHQTFTRDKAYSYSTDCDCAPFDWVPGEYEERLKLGKSGKGMVLKLALNSLYGKTMQSIGHPVYANPIWGSLITALTRAKLSSICHWTTPALPGVCDCDLVLMLATDGIFTTAPLHEPSMFLRPPLETSKAILGGWDLKELTSLHIIMPGMYFKTYLETPDEDAATRGIPRKNIMPQKDAFMALGASLVRGEIEMAEAYIMIPLEQFVGLRAAHHRNRLDLAGEWILCGENGEGKKASYDWTNKRDPRCLRTEWNGTPVLLTRPYNKHMRETTPYDKNIGRMLWSRRLTANLNIDQPDFGESIFDYADFNNEEEDA